MEPALENIRKLPSSAYLHCPTRLSDAFMEIIAYTGELVDKLSTGVLDFPTETINREQVYRNYAEMIFLSEDLVQLWGFNPDQWRDALFPVCALIDELIMGTTWAEKEDWQKCQLQLMYFGTTNAGEEFFQRLAGLGPENPESNALREIYSFCLAMGFKGKYYSPRDAAKLRDIRDATLRALTGETGEDTFPGQLFPGAYSLETNFRKKKIWNRKFTLLNITIFLLPVAVFTAMFVMYRSMLATIVDNFFK